MPTEIIVAIIGVVGIIVGALIRSILPEYISEFISLDRTKTTEVWECEWDIKFPDHRRKEIDDKIKLDIKKSGKIEGAGFTEDQGKYEIKGDENEFIRVFRFYGVDNKSSISGSVVLSKEVDNSIMKGRWIQLNVKNEIIGGSVKMKKISM